LDLTVLEEVEARAAAEGVGDFSRRDIREDRVAMWVAIWESAFI
jgi:hypothetical protein